ncbi:hypothetical protein FRC04_002420 [Tulasnella sp. 424]|nr:hypothetical protein FRC04_002420 [Tulasnella sp. 424]KAG8972850.1 hypothetical protein FRC05_009489 [Tulasnella sp. 425]
MHQVLGIYEILDHIFSYSSKRDLALAARVSRLWSSIALDYLWREIDSVFPLLKVGFPPVKVDGERVLTGRIEPQNWERFQHYARRIRRLSHDDEHIYQLTSSHEPSLSQVWSALALRHPGIDPLLPKIQEISWSVDYDMDNLPHVIHFISSSLKALTITASATNTVEDVATACRFFDTLTGLTGLELENFTFEGSDGEAKVAERLASFLKGQHKLKALRIPNDSYDEPRTTQDMLFPNLPIGLRELDTSVEFYEKSDYTSRIQTILQRLPNLRALRLILSSLGSWNLSDFRSLSPLLQNPNLEELTLLVSTELHLNRSDIHALGRALPNMAQLNLRLHYTILPAVRVPATWLVDFAKAFPKLQALTIRLDNIRTSLPPPGTPNEEQVNAFNPAAFRVLDVGDSVLSEEDVSRMAEFLGLLCLNPLFEIEYEGKKRAPADTAVPWRDTEAMIKLIQRSNSSE